MSLAFTLPLGTTASIATPLIILISYFTLTSMVFSKKKWSPKGQHCYVTGGSTGLGLCVAQELTKAGAHVSIVARNEARLADALQSLETFRQSASQILKSYSFALDTATASADALEAACVVHGGRSPDALFLCAGSAKPMFFVETTEEDMTKGMTNGYWLQTWTAWAAVKKMVKETAKGRIVFVGSTVSYMGFVGYGSYAPAKHALRGLVDTLRNECILYDIDVHLYCPNTMHTPGYAEEQKTRPKIQSKIEEGDTPTTPEHAAKVMIKGVRNGEAHIAGDFVTNLFRASTRGSAPYGNFFMDSLYDSIAYIGIPFWRRGADAQVRAHKTEHDAYLRERKLRDPIDPSTSRLSAVPSGPVIPPQTSLTDRSPITQHPLIDSGKTMIY